MTPNAPVLNEKVRLAVLNNGIQVLVCSCCYAMIGAAGDPSNSKLLASLHRCPSLKLSPF